MTTKDNNTNNHFVKSFLRRILIRFLCLKFSLFVCQQIIWQIISGKSPNTSLSFRYNANNEELEELFQECDDDPPTPQPEPPATRSESASPKKTSSIIDKYFKSIRNEKPIEKIDDIKQDVKSEESRAPSVPKEVTSSPMKDYLNRLGKRSTSEVLPEGKESNETWKIFHDFKFKIAQAVEDMKTRSVEG